MDKDMAGENGADVADETIADPNIRILKAIVIGLGLAMVVCAGILVWGLTRKAPPRAVAPPVATQDVPTQFGERTLSLPRGAKLLDVSQSEARLMLRVRLASGIERLILVDAATGDRLGSLDIVNGD